MMKIKLIFFINNYNLLTIIEWNCIKNAKPRLKLTSGKFLKPLLFCTTKKFILI